MQQQGEHGPIPIPGRKEQLDCLFFKVKIYYNGENLQHQGNSRLKSWPIPTEHPKIQRIEQLVQSWNADKRTKREQSGRPCWRISLQKYNHVHHLDIPTTFHYGKTTDAGDY